MDSKVAVERALRLINPAPTPEQLTSLRSSLFTLLGHALKVLAEKVAYDTTPERRQTLVTEYSASIVSGTITLSSLTHADGNPLLGALGVAEIISAGSVFPWVRKPDRMHMALERSSYNLIYYCVSDGKIHTTATDATATIRANRVPTIASVPAELEDELVEILATGMAQPEEASVGG